MSCQHADGEGGGFGCVSGALASLRVSRIRPGAPGDNVCLVEMPVHISLLCAEAAKETRAGRGCSLSLDDSADR